MNDTQVNQTIAANKLFYDNLFKNLKDTTAERFIRGMKQMETRLRTMEATFGHKYSPTQPRVPAGNSDGGQWTGGSGGGADATRMEPVAYVQPNMDAAIHHLETHAEPKSKKKCATYVRRALNAGGFKVQNTEQAKNYGPKLEEAGFKPSASNSHPSFYPPIGYTPRKGDVAVVQNYPGGNPAGHMTMYSGSQWISDWPQRSFWASSHYRDYGASYVIYRYPQ